MIAILHSKKLKNRRLVDASLGETPKSRHHALYSVEKNRRRRQFECIHGSSVLGF
jgi:hypothetical protein